MAGIMLGAGWTTTLGSRPFHITGQRRTKGSRRGECVRDRPNIYCPKKMHVNQFLKPTSTITCSDISQRGKARIANIYGKGEPIRIVLAKECVLRTPWQVSSFDGGERCSLDICMDDVLEQVVKKIDEGV